MTIKAILELKKTHKEMTEVLDELEVYEDGVDADWTEFDSTIQKSKR